MAYGYFAGNILLLLQNPHRQSVMTASAEPWLPLRQVLVFHDPAGGADFIFFTQSISNFGFVFEGGSCCILPTVARQACYL
jgi:FPC/CPF motif-containing protein YcgG